MDWAKNWRDVMRLNKNDASALCVIRAAAVSSGVDGESVDAFLINLTSGVADILAPSPAEIIMLPADVYQLTFGEIANYWIGRAGSPEYTLELARVQSALYRCANPAV